VLQHTDGALAASDGATAVLTRFRRATTLRLQHLQGDGDLACKNEPLGRQIGLARLEQTFGLERRR